MTVAEVAEWLRVRPSEVIAAIHAGEIPGLRLGGNIRISRNRLLSLAEESSAAPEPPSAPATASGDRIPPPAGVVWLEDLNPSDAFSHGWPQKGGGTYDEPYTRGWKGRIAINRSEVAVRVGQTVRFERGRLTIFFDDYPVAEFMDTPDGKQWVSLIKPNGKTTIGRSDLLPPLYQGVEVAPYQEATGAGGSGRPTGLAVLIGRDDLHSAVHHAAARQIGKQGQPVAGPPSYFWIGVEFKAPRPVDAGPRHAMALSIGSAYNSQMLKASQVNWPDERTAHIFMAAGGMNSRDAERAVIEMVKRHAGVTAVAAEREVAVRVTSSESFDPIEYRQFLRSQRTQNH